MTTLSDADDRAPDDAGGAGLDDVVTISRAELAQLRDAARRDPASSAEGELLRELSARERTIAGLRSSFKEAVRDRELATALAGRPLVASAVGQLIKLFRDELDVYEELGEYKVASRDGRAVGEWVAERLASPGYSHFCLPTTRGGVVTRGQGQVGPRDPAPAEPKTLGEMVISQWRASAASAAPSSGWSGRR